MADRLISVTLNVDQGEQALVCDGLDSLIGQTGDKTLQLTIATLSNRIRAL